MWWGIRAPPHRSQWVDTAPSEESCRPVGKKLYTIVPGSTGELTELN
jgi:hypothetical protein